MSTDIVASLYNLFVYLCCTSSSAEARAQTPVSLSLPPSPALSLFSFSLRLPLFKTRKNEKIFDILYIYIIEKYRKGLKKIACAPLEKRLSFCDSSAQASQRTGESVNRLVLSRRPACDDAIVSGADRDIDRDVSCTSSTGSLKWKDHNAIPNDA